MQRPGLYMCSAWFYIERGGRETHSAALLSVVLSCWMLLELSSFVAFSSTY